MPVGKKKEATTTEAVAPKKKGAPWTRFTVSFVRSDLRLDLVTDKYPQQIATELTAGTLTAWRCPSPQDGHPSQRKLWSNMPYILTASGVEYLALIAEGTIDNE